MNTIESSRDFFEGYLIPRVPHKPTIRADENNTSTHDLYHLVKKKNISKFYN